MSPRIAVVGECMLEVSRGGPDSSTTCPLPMNMGYGGDTLNAAIYLARLDISVSYVTALGDDPLSHWMVAQWKSEGVGCDLVDHVEGAVPGLYLIETDEAGERSFFYWRDQSPVKCLLDDKISAEHLFERLADYEYFYLSGITLAVLSETSRHRLLAALPAYRARGGRVIFDGNYRPRLWNDIDDTRRIYNLMYQSTDIALPTLEDEQALYGELDAPAVIDQLQAAGVSEIVLKMGEQGCTVVSGEMTEHVATTPVPVVDTTSAGDSFNAGYLAERCRGSSPVEAATSGHRLAGAVIQHRGAIIPASAMPSR